MEFVLIANDKGRETFVSHDRIHQIISPGNSRHMPPHVGTNIVLPDLTLWGPFRRSLDPIPPEIPPHTTVDTHLNVTARPGHTAKPNTTSHP